MSRSSNATTLPWRRLTAAVAVLATGLIFVGSLPAASEPTPPIVPAPSSDPGGSAATTPILDIDAPILDIATSTSDIGGQARLEEAPHKTKVTLDSTIAFGKDSAKLRPKATKRLAEIAGLLKAKGAGKVTVIGYTDDLGSAAHGQKLSEQRAKAVSGVLKKGLGGGFGFTVAGKGEADPAVPNDSEANRRINRRVEITYDQG